MASYLVCQAEQVSIPLMNGAVIGRTAGDYANLLGKCIYISGMHARLTQNGSVWSITDLGSRNGTKVNGVACQPNDEAYSLNDGSNGFGKDAMPVLLTKLLDYKNRMVSIAAGYPREMRQWINTNSGLESRYTRTIQFEDYTGDELAQIFRLKVKGKGLKLTPDADAEMVKYFNTLVYNKGANFANAREANNFFDRVKLNQGRRLRRVSPLPGFNRDDLFVFVADDMIVD